MRYREGVLVPNRVELIRVGFAGECGGCGRLVADWLASDGQVYRLDWVPMCPTRDVHTCGPAVEAVKEMEADAPVRPLTIAPSPITSQATNGDRPNERRGVIKDL